MSKTVDQQIEKSAMLIKAMRTKMDEVAHLGITTEQLDKMEKQLDELRQESQRCEQLRSQLSEQVHKSNEQLQEVKRVFIEKKNIVKGFYPQERWIDFGVADKR
jgi:uncharacterized protein YydD (DUF2326 family)